MNQQNIKKLYYSIGEVSRITSLKRSVLRSWETEFPELRPSKNRAGNRIYRLHDIKTVFLIKKLLIDEKYTFEGARQKLRALRRNKDPQLKLGFDDLRRDDALLEIVRGLKDILAFLDGTANETRAEQLDES